MEKGYIPYQKIIDKLDVNEGEILIVTSNITKMAFLSRRNEGSFDSNLLIDSFQKKLGKEGTLILPSYNHNLKSGQKFDIKNTTPVTGALALAAFKRNDFKRTKNPLHSFLVRGKYADELSNLNNKSSFGKDSPFAFFLEKNAKMLFISTNVTAAFTFTHFVEESEKVHYRKYQKLPIKYTNEKNQFSVRDYLLYKKKTGWDLDFKPLEELFRKSILNEKTINGLKFQSLNISKAYDIILKDIRENKAKSIAYFSLKLFVRDTVKQVLKKLKIFRTTFDKIQNANNIL
ncbi:MAG: AAC(3) family N-acetyltransferase [Bacteroidales bacterium]|nr:AAC(3) family N-acetyltransferase [Bacteroidales bacterium]